MTPISSFENEQTKVARDCRTLFHPARRKALYAHYWNYAKRAATLTVNSSITPTFWDYAYTMPDDLIVIRSIHPANDLNSKCDYDIEYNATYGNVIMADSTTLYIVYTFDNDDMTSLGEGFRDVLSFVLARDLCGALEKSASEAGLTDTAYRRALAWARSVDGMEIPMQPLAHGTWVKSRFGLHTDQSNVNA